MSAEKRFNALDVSIFIPTEFQNIESRQICNLKSRFQPVLRFAEECEEAFPADVPCFKKDCEILLPEKFMKKAPEKI